MARKPKVTVNRTNDMVLKETLADAALEVLINEGKISLNDCPGIEVEFGYLIDIKNHGLEGLFRVIKDKNSHYFAVQKENLSLVSISGMEFLSASSYMVKYHLGQEHPTFSKICLKEELDKPGMER